MTTTLALIFPIFGLYITAIIKFLITNSAKQSTDSLTVTREFVFISFLIPLLFVLFLTSIIILKTLNTGFSTFEEFKATLSLGETALGVYVGLILSSLYEMNRKHTVDPKQT